MRLFHFFYDNLPSAALIAWLFPVSLLFSWLSLRFAGLLKQKYEWRTGLTRKVFHFLIFFFVFIIQINFSLPGTFIVGWAVTAVLMLSIKLNEGNILYEAIAREQDAPYRSRYIVYSYLATFAGGVLTNLLFGKFYAIFGYLITGIGDAVAEPIGVLFGKHKYRVINFNKREAYRSVEGSVAVFIATFFVLLTCSYYMHDHICMNIPGIIYCSLVCTLVEAISPQGWDNLLLQLTGGLSVLFFLS